MSKAHRLSFSQKIHLCVNKKKDETQKYFVFNVKTDILVNNEVLNVKYKHAYKKTKQGWQ